MKVCIRFKKSNVERFTVFNRRIIMFMFYYPQRVVLDDLDLCVMTHVVTVWVVNNVMSLMVPVHLVVNLDTKDSFAKKVIMLQRSHIKNMNMPCGY